jgi:uncharacterized membrane protein YbaN (DUF454 family)
MGESREDQFETEGKSGRFSVKTLILTALGFLFLGLGAVGAFVPVLPTTPFVLLAAGCFYSCNRRIHAWLKKNPFFGPYLENYRTRQGISLRLKITSIAMLWAGLIISALIVKTLWIYIVLAAVGIGVTAHLLRIKTKEKE